MKYYAEADTPRNDCLEYQLLNLTFLWVYPEDEAIRISYQRSADTFDKYVTYSDLRAIHPKLPEAFEKIAIEENQGSYGLSQAAIVLTAHCLGCYLDLRAVGYRRKGYHYLADITSVHSSDQPGSFELVASAYDGKLDKKLGLLLPSVQPFEYLTLEASMIDKFWPGASGLIPVMEKLGYTNIEMMQSLNDGIPGVAPMALPDIDLCMR